MRIFSQPLVVLDTETTGIFGRDEWAQVIELGAVALDEEGVEVGRFASFVQPTVLDERANEALAVNHITPAMLEGAPDALMVGLRFVQFMGQYGARFVTAYNVAFDKQGAEQMGMELQWASCVMERAKADMRVSRWLKLAKAAEHYGVPVVGEAHRAETDARTAAGVAVAIRRKEVETRAAAARTSAAQAEVSR